MTCSSCGHRWCWVCGLPLSHWSHKMSDVMPLSCKRVPSSIIGWFCQFLLFLLGFAFLPIFIFGVGLIGTIYGCVSFTCKGRCIKNSCRRGYDNKYWCFFKFVCLVFPLMTILFTLGFAFGAAAGALGVALGTLPAYIFHTYYFVRSCYWWCKSSRVKD